VPLVVAEVNPGALAGYTARNIVANPNCSTMQLVVALRPLHDAAGLERVTLATYQSVSGGGRRAIQELGRQTAELLNGRPIEPEVFPKQIAFNCLPHIDSFQPNGYTREEMKLVWETRKILGLPELAVSATAVRVPVFYGHAEAVQLETRTKLTVAEARALLEQAPGVVVMDEPVPGGYPTQVTEAAGTDPVFVGRLREDLSHPRGLALWIVADNVRKGAALNSVQLAELLVKHYL
jgi:aspartate-semialdehyde dehydrogenase